MGSGKKDDIQRWANRAPGNGSWRWKCGSVTMVTFGGGAPAKFWDESLKTLGRQDGYFGPLLNAENS
jgi:hypothetical protein